MTEVIAYPGGVRGDGLPVALADPARLAAVRATGLLDTGPEEAFDDLARLASAVTGCGRAFITLVDERRSFWKSCVGVDAHDPVDRQSPVRESFCYVLVGLGGEAFVVEDAARDPRTRDHPSVGPMAIGAWAGYPVLGLGGEVLGSMCVIDDQPHRWRPAELKALETLARAVGNELHLRHSLSVSRRAQAASAELARSLQESLLPPRLTPLPGLEAAASYLPAGGDTVVGDFFDLFRASGQRWATVIGDVCGHGTEAAKITALARYTARAEGTQHSSPATVLARLNGALLDQHPGGTRFLTAAYATFRASRGGVTGKLCLAGHPQPFVLRASGDVEPAGRPGMLLGIFPDVTLFDVRFRLAPGDTLLLYTDGATEARSPESSGGHRPMLGEDGLARLLAACAGMTAEQVLGHLTAAIAEYNHNRPTDDTALLALRVPPALEPTTPG